MTVCDVLMKDIMGSFACIFIIATIGSSHVVDEMTHTNIVHKRLHLFSFQLSGMSHLCSHMFRDFLVTILQASWCILLREPHPRHEFKTTVTWVLSHTTQRSGFS